MDGASFNFDDFIFETGDAEVMQSSVGTSAATGATGTDGTSSGAPSHLSSSLPPRLSRGDMIPIVHSLETHGWILHRLPISSRLLSRLFAFLVVFVI